MVAESRRPAPACPPAQLYQDRAANDAAWAQEAARRPMARARDVAGAMWQVRQSAGDLITCAANRAGAVAH